MIGALIQLIVALIIVGVLWWAVQQLLPLIPLPEPIRRVIYVILVVILVLIVVYALLAIIGAALPGSGLAHWRVW